MHLRFNGFPLRRLMAAARTTRSPHLAVFTVAVAAALAQGCGTRSCTAVGWQEGLTVRVTSDEPLTPGNYRLVMKIPGQTFEVSLTLEDPKNTQQGVYASQHAELGSWQANASLSGFIQSGTYKASGEIAISRSNGASGGPESLTVTVLQDDVPIGTLSLEAIDYQRHEFNGPGCGEATIATATVAITPRH